MVCPSTAAVFFSVTVSIHVAVGFGTSDSLRLVNLVYRHGDRSPYTTYKNNPTPNTTWIDGLAWLTKKGERQHYSLGRFLRRSYDGFLNKEYSHMEITVESSGVDRCLMSAYSNLAGLYPPSEDQMLNKDISWQPIPVHTRPKKEDNMLALGKPCPKYDKIYADSLKSDRVKNLEEENKEFFDYLSENSGYSVNIDNLWILSDTIFCEQQHNISMPSWVNDTIYQQLREFEAWGWDLLYREKEENRLMGGPLLKEWLRLSKTKIEDEEYTNTMNMFSAHDSTVVAVLMAMGVYNGEIPPYTTTVFMELHQGPGDFYVELYLRNISTEDPNDDTQPHPLTLPGCEFKCPYRQFVSLTRDDIPVDWDAECSLKSRSQQTSTDDSSINYKTAFIATVAVYSSVLIFLIMVVIGISFKRNRRAEPK